jgi:DNA-binding CsgD family transcriptional regulator
MRAVNRGLGGGGALMTENSGTRQATNSARPPLNTQEHDVLAVSARGLNLGEVARTLELAEDEVRQALMAARDKLGAKSKLEAVLIAVRRGDIKLES